MQFTADGSGLVYVTRRDRLIRFDLASGSRQPLATCQYGCKRAAVSPDLGTVAYAAGAGFFIQKVSTGALTWVGVPGRDPVGLAAWSPDGTTLAFTRPDGLYTMQVDGSDLRLVHAATEPSTMTTNVAWSPDGSRLAFFDTSLIARKNFDDTQFTAMTIGRDGQAPVVLHDAGYCFCGGLAPPSITWSPDGTLVAVATTLLTSGPGVYTERPDGTNWRVVSPGYWTRLTWQPVID